MNQPRGEYGADDHVVDFILGITFEIWEQRGVELIERYYSEDCVIYGLDGITRGAAEVVTNTWKTLEAFPDRLLLAENVIWSGDRADGYYTSHRLLSLMTNKGPTQYGPATGVRVRMTNIADCIVENGQVTGEWLVRDNMTLATQLGAEPIAAARQMARQRSPELAHWIDAEINRVNAVTAPESDAGGLPTDDPTAFAWRVLASCWRGDRDTFDQYHAPYSVMHRSPTRHLSGRDQVFEYYRSLRQIIGGARFSVDHVASQPFSDNGIDIAVRWTVAGVHEGPVMGLAATGRPMFLMGVTHWRCIAGRIVFEWTIFDDLAVLSQIVAQIVAQDVGQDDDNNID